MNQQPPTFLDETGANPDATPSPRAFAIGTGVAFQTVGAVLIFVAVLGGGVSAWAIPRAGEPLSNWTDFFQKEHLPAALMTVALLNSFVGGMAMIAVGVGLQGEQRGSGRAAMVVSGLMGFCYFAVGVSFLVATGRILPAMVAFILSLLSSLMFMLAGHSAALLRKFPPPSDLSAATPELLEEFRQKRLERLKHYEP